MNLNAIKNKTPEPEPAHCTPLTRVGRVCVSCTHFSLPGPRLPGLLPASLLTDLPDSALVSSAHFQRAASDPPKKEIRSRPSSALHPDTAPTSLGKSQSPHRPQALQLHPAPYLSCLILHNAHLALFQQQAPLLFLIRELGPTSEPSPPLSLLPGRPLPRQHQAFLPSLASLSPSPISFRNLTHQHIIPDHLTLHDFSFSLTLTTF